MQKLILILGATSLLFTSSLNINNSATISSNIVKTASDAANFICHNFDNFVYETNKNLECNWKAKSITDMHPILIDDTVKQYEGYFLDFDSTNGYAVIGEDYTFLDFQTTGYSPYKDTIGDIYPENQCYSTISGYLYLNDGEYVSVENNKDEIEYYLNTTGCNYNDIYEDNYSGCDHIKNTDLYISNKYGDDWVLCDHKSLLPKQEKYNNQSDLSCYKSNRLINNNLSSYSEGNCWFVSAYNVLQSLADATGDYKKTVNAFRKIYYSNMPKSNDTINYIPSVDEPKMYYKFYDEEGNNKTDIVATINGTIYYSRVLRNGPITFPKLYKNVRQYVIDRWNKIDSGTIYNTADIINEIGARYGYEFKAKGTVLMGIYGNRGIYSIRNNLPFAFCTARVSNSNYKDHIMAGIGFKSYNQTWKWWIFKYTKYVYLYELIDGHYDTPLFLDLTAFTGFGGIVTLNWN